MASKRSAAPSALPRSSGDKFTAIFADIAAGAGTVKTAEANGVTRKEFYRAIAADEDLGNRYARAKDSGLIAMADDLLEISDEASNEAGAVARARLKVDSRKWLLSKLAPKKYGDKLDVDMKGTFAVTIASSDAGVL